MLLRRLKTLRHLQQTRFTVELCTTAPAQNLYLNSVFISWSSKPNLTDYHMTDGQVIQGDGSHARLVAWGRRSGDPFRRVARAGADGRPGAPGRYPTALPGVGAVIQFMLGRRPGLSMRAIQQMCTILSYFFTVFFIMYNDSVYFSFFKSLTQEQETRRVMDA